jgi:hypothetical protein
MCFLRTLLVLASGLAAAGMATAQASGGMRWRGANQAALGLQAGSSAFGGTCGSVSFPCGAESAVLPLYGNRAATRSLNMQLGPLDSGVARLANSPRAQGLGISLVGQANVVSALGVYGRLGTTLGGSPALAGSGVDGHGLSYGVGLSWDFSRRGSAIVGWDSYDFRTLAGEREVRATSLGLQWRY